MKETLGRPVLAFCLYFCLLVTPAFAQQAPVIAPPAKADYSQEPFVIEQMSSKVAFQDDGTSVRQQTTRIRVQNDAGVQQWGLIELPFESGTSTLEIDYVRVRKPDGTVVVTPPDNIQDLDAEITRDAPLYSDLRVKHVAVKGLGPGDVLEFQAEWTSTKPLAPGQFWFDYNFDKSGIVLDERLEISLPADRPVKVKGPQATQTVALVSGRRVYAWTGSNLSSKPAKKKGRALLDATLGLNPSSDVQVTSFKSWDEIASWYWNLQKDRVEPSPAVRAKAADLTKGLTDDSAKLHAIYDFVSTHYRYIGIDFGIGRYQPHAADDVLSNNFGDCKDKQTLLASLLQAAGIQADPVLISTTNRLDPDVPSPAQFDHVIGYIPQGKSGLWLDTTPEVTTFGYLLQVLRDKQALVISPGGAAQIMTTPADPPEPAVRVFKVDAKLAADGTLTAQMENTDRDDLEPLMRAAFRQLSSAQWNDLVQQVSRNMGFAGTVSNVTASSPEATSTPFRFSYTYVRKDYPDWADHQVVAPGLPFYMPTQDDDAAPSDPIFLGSPMVSESDTRVELPDGYTPTPLPNVDLVRDYAEYHASYSREGNTLVVRRVMKGKLREVPVAENADYKKFVEGIQKDVDGYVQVASTNAPPLESLADSNRYLASSLNALPDSTVPAANTFESDAMASVRQFGPNSAVSGLKQAVAADPKFTRAWIRLAELQAFTHDPDEAETSFRGAISSDPNQPALYKVFALTMSALHRDDAAVEAWQALLKVAPDDPDAPANLGHLLVGKKQYAQAIPLLQSALKAYSKNALAASDLAAAYILTGKPDDGHAALKQALALEKPGPAFVYNNVAWTLAEANQDLPEALDYAQKAVAQEEHDSQIIDMQALSMNDVAHPSRLSAYWDTLGWVQFRLGHLEDAENLINAAFDLSQWGDEADHLGQVYEKEHKTQDAIRLYRLALATTERRVQGNEQDAVNTRLQALGSDSGEAPTPLEDHPRGKPIKIYHAPGEELTDMRTLKLSRIVPGSAEAEFFLLFAPGPKLQEVKFISGSEELKSAASTLTAAPLQVPFPKDSSARILRRALVMCSEASGCSVTLYPIDSVHSVN